MSGSAIALKVTAIDGTANAINKINARMEEFGKRQQAQIDRVTAPFRNLGRAIATASNVTGLTRIGSAIGGIARAGQNAFQRMGQLVPLIGALGSAATIAGVTRMVTAWAEWGNRIGLASQRMGIAANSLAGFEGAARLAGSSAGSLTNGMQALGQTMYDAVGGRNTEAIVMFNTLGVAFRDASGHARAVNDVLPQVADKIASIKDPFAQAQAAAALFGSAAEDLLPFLRKGSAGIREYVDMSRRYLAFTDASAASANRLRMAQTRVTLAVEGLQNRISERLEPILTPLLSHFAEWIASSPQVAHGVEALGSQVQRLGSYLENADWPAFGTKVEGWADSIGHVMQVVGGPQTAIEGLIALMVGRFALRVIAPFYELAAAITAATFKIAILSSTMAGQGGLLSVLGWAGRIGGTAGALGLGFLGWEGINSLSDATQPKDDGLPNLLHNMAFDPNPLHWRQSYHPDAPGKHSDRAPPSVYPGSGTQGLGPLRNLRDNNPTNLKYAGQPGATQDGPFARFPNMESGVAADLNQYLLYQDRDHLTSIEGMVHKATPAADNPGVEDYINRVAAALGVKRGDPINLHDPGMATRFIMALSPNEGGTPDIEAVRRGVGFRLGILPSMLPGPAGPPVAAPAAQGPALTAPSAQGAPIALTSPRGSNDNDGKSTVRVEFGGQLPSGVNMKLSNPQGVDVGGPLVERPMLLGANP